MTFAALTVHSAQCTYALAGLHHEHAHLYIKIHNIAIARS